MSGFSLFGNLQGADNTKKDHRGTTNVTAEDVRSLVLVPLAKNVQSLEKMCAIRPRPETEEALLVTRDCNQTLSDVVSAGKTAKETKEVSPSSPSSPSF